jgi:hypothetical protein
VAGQLYAPGAHSVLVLATLTSVAPLLALLLRRAC